MLHFEVYTSGINCPVHVKVTDDETGLSGEATGWRAEARDAALEDLQQKRKAWESNPASVMPCYRFQR